MKVKIVGACAIAAAAVALSPLSAGGSGRKIPSPPFQKRGNIPSKFTCDGANVNPPLHIDQVPAGAKSLALIVDDPDAPGGIFVHWLVWNINTKKSAVGGDSAAPHG